jgi:hypothetical protein
MLQKHRSVVPVGCDWRMWVQPPLEWLCAFKGVGPQQAESHRKTLHSRRPQGASHMSRSCWQKNADTPRVAGCRVQARAQQEGLQVALGAAEVQAASLQRQLRQRVQEVEQLTTLSIRGDSTVQEYMANLRVSAAAPSTPSPHPRPSIAGHPGIALQQHVNGVPSHRKPCTANGMHPTTGACNHTCRQPWATPGPRGPPAALLGWWHVHVHTTRGVQLLRGVPQHRARSESGG